MPVKNCRPRPNPLTLKAGAPRPLQSGLSQSTSETEGASRQGLARNMSQAGQLLLGGRKSCPALARGQGQGVPCG